MKLFTHTPHTTHPSHTTHTTHPSVHTTQCAPTSHTTQCAPTSHTTQRTASVHTTPSTLPSYLPFLFLVISTALVFTFVEHPALITTPAKAVASTYNKIFHPLPRMSVEEYYESYYYKLQKAEREVLKERGVVLLNSDDVFFRSREKVDWGSREVEAAHIPARLEEVYIETNRVAVGYPELRVVCSMVRMNESREVRVESEGEGGVESERYFGEVEGEGEEGLGEELEAETSVEGTTYDYVIDTTYDYVIDTTVEFSNIRYLYSKPENRAFIHYRIQTLQKELQKTWVEKLQAKINGLNDKSSAGEAGEEGAQNLLGTVKVNVMVVDPQNTEQVLFIIGGSSDDSWSLYSPIEKWRDEDLKSLGTFEGVSIKYYESRVPRYAEYKEYGTVVDDGVWSIERVGSVVVVE